MAALLCTPSCDTPPVIIPPCETCPRMAMIDQCFVPLEISRADYQERLRGMWLAENVANWTGLLTEFQRKQAPFFRDEDWGTNQGRVLDEGSSRGRIELNFLDPWGADDDTDIEFMYMRAMTEAGTTHLTPTDIQATWQRHVLPHIYVWVSNAQARDLFDQNPVVLPPSTGFIAANDQAWMIDAQLTTELFGALSPGRPAHALQLADLPMRTTASGHALHAAQFFVALHALAPVVRQDLPPDAQIECMVLGARELIPSTSKARDVIDFVLEAHHQHPSDDDWEATRDAIARRYQSEDEASGFTYLEWYESSVNLAGGLLALLYGHGDLVRTIQIGSLSGWDSDNGTATMGGLLGLMHGEPWVRDQIMRSTSQTMSSEYRIARTRVNFDPESMTLTEIADELMPLVEDAVMETGGSVSDGWLRSARVSPMELDVAANPHVAWLERGLLAHLRSQGIAVTITSTGTVTGAPLDFLRDPPDLDASGRDRDLQLRNEGELRARPATPHHVTLQATGEATVTLMWSTPQPLEGVRLIEGPLPTHFIQLEAHDAEGWHVVETEPFLDNVGRAFEVHDLMLDSVITADGLRILVMPDELGASFTAIDGLIPLDSLP